MRFRALLLVAIAAGIHAGPIGVDEQTCSQVECVASPYLGYEQGRTYSFQYEADTATTVAGATEERSAIRTTTRADIYVQSPCELVLTLRDTRIEEYSPTDSSIRQISAENEQFRDALERRALRFSFQDGRVESVCLSEAEPTWVANFKRGILSAFQNTMGDLDKDTTVSETDVSGTCKTEYRVIDSSRGTISKTKDLLSCMNRAHYYTAVQATPYNVPSDIQSLPIIRSSHQCEQTFSQAGRRTLQKAECHETHLFQPLSKQESGAITTVTQTLTFISDSRQSQPRTEPFTRRSTLTFEHETHRQGSNDDQTEVTSIMAEICQDVEVRPQTPETFSQLVTAMRRLDVNTLRRVHKMVESGRICSNNRDMARKYFHDAVPATGTAASVSLIQELIANGEVVGAEAQVWITSLAFVKEPTAEMIAEAKKILMTTSRPDDYLSISSMVHRFCMKNTEDNTDVQEMVEFLTQNLGYNCITNSPMEEAKVLLSIKALGNLGISNNNIRTLTRCAGNQDIPMELRLAAIQAYRRLPCSEDREFLMTLLMAKSEDAEVRIASYLELMRCPSQVLITQVKDILEHEEVNQVGSFIWTHLTNLQESGDPLKQALRELVKDDKLSKQFNMDVRKFSRNYEGTFFMDSINVGTTYESNLIWSPSSFLPRSAMLNLTLDMFGKAINIFEVGAHMEGVEKYLEKFFGPSGYFPQSTVNDIIKGQIDSIDSTLRDKMLQSYPKASMYFKMFGNELSYMDLMSMASEAKNFNFLDILLKLAQNNEMTYTKSSKFMEVEMTVPTATGLPLKLAVNGTASVDLKVGGVMDVRKAATFPSTFNIDGYLKPSAAVTITGTMGVDAFVTGSGLKMKSTLHTATEMNGRVVLQDSKIFSATFNTPREKSEIFTYDKEIYLMHRGQHFQPVMITDNVIEKGMCTGETFNRLTGMKLCGNIRMPLSNKENVPSFQLQGPSHYSMTLENADSHTSYQIEARLETLKERRNADMAITHVAKLAFDTPGSRTDRRFLAEYNIDRMEKRMTANFRCPYKEAALEGYLVNNDVTKSANIEITLDGTKKYSAVAELTRDNKGDIMIYQPRVVLASPYSQPISLDGTIKINPREKLDVNMKLENIFRSPVTLTAEMEKANQNRYTTEMMFVSPVITTQASGFLVIRDNMLSTRTEVKYDFHQGQSHTITLNGKFKDAGNNNAIRYNVITAIQTTQWPEYNHHLDSSFNFNRQKVETSIDLTYGSDQSNEDKHIVISQEANYAGDKQAMNIDGTLNAKWQAMGLNFNSKLNHVHTLHRELNSNVELTYAPGKTVTLGVALRKESMRPLVLHKDIQLTIPSRQMRWTNDLK